MSAELNPYEPPRFLFDQQKRRLERFSTVAVTIAAGIVLGASCFLLALSLIPTSVDWLDYNIQLAKNLGFLYPSAIGLWWGCSNRSMRYAAAGVFIGSGIGAANFLLSGHDLRVVLWLSCIIVGVESTILSVVLNGKCDGAAFRFAKGLLAGIASLAVYFCGLFILLNIIWAVVLPPLYIPSIVEYRNAMWKVGPAAMSIASGLFFLLVCSPKVEPLVIRAQQPLGGAQRNLDDNA